MRTTELRGAPWRYPALLLLAGLVVAGSACTQSTGETASPRRTGDITRAELEEQTYANVYEAVRRLRPNWLRRRGSPTPTNPTSTPVVYLDGFRLGAAAEMRRLETESVETMSLLSAADATTRFGTGHTSGAILLITRGR